MNITKSLFVEFTTNPKLAWFHIHNKTAHQNIQEALYWAVDWDTTGQEVENCVRMLLDDVQDIEYKGGWSLASAFKTTKELINQDTPALYQPRFQYNNCKMRADFLVYNNWKYDVWEVKAKNTIRKPTKAKSIKDTLLADLSYQNYILKKVLWDKFSWKCYLCYLNKEYVRASELQVEQLIKKEQVDQELWSDEQVEKILSEMMTTLPQEREDFEKTYPYNWEDHLIYFGEPAPKWSIWYIPWMWKKKKTLYELWKTDIMGLWNTEKQLLLSAKGEESKSSLYVEKYQKAERIIDKKWVEQKLSQLEYPLYFYDYETITSPIPLFRGSRPRSQVPVQYSLHKIDKDWTITHKEALIEWKIDDNKAIVDQLYQDLEWGKQWTFIVWFKGFENTRNEEMGELYPEYKEFLASVNERTFDLMEVFSEWHFFDRSCLGSASIKKLLPVLTELSYDWLNIPNGWIATEVIYRIATGTLTGDELIQARKDLLEYCEQDTWAMVRIWQELVKLIK